MKLYFNPSHVLNQAMEQEAYWCTVLCEHFCNWSCSSSDRLCPRLPDEETEGKWWLTYDMVAPQIYIFHIYTWPKFTKPTFTQNPDLHKLKFTQLRFTHTQIYTAQYWHTQIYTTQIYTKLKPNLHCAKLCKVQNWVECKLFHVRLHL